MGKQHAPIRPVLLTVEHAADFLSVDPKTVQSLISDGDIEAVTLGGKTLIPGQAIVQLVDTLTHSPVRPPIRRLTSIGARIRTRERSSADTRRGHSSSICSGARTPCRLVLPERSCSF